MPELINLKELKRRIANGQLDPSTSKSSNPDDWYLIDKMSDGRTALAAMGRKHLLKEYLK